MHTTRSPHVFPAAPGPSIHPGVSPTASPAELLGLLQTLLQAYGELHSRLADLEQAERLRAARTPRSVLGIDY